MQELGDKEIEGRGHQSGHLEQRGRGKAKRTKQSMHDTRKGRLNSVFDC